MHAVLCNIEIDIMIYGKIATKKVIAYYARKVLKLNARYLYSKSAHVYDLQLI